MSDNKEHTTADKVAGLQDDLRESAHKIWLAGLGALAVAEEEGSKLFKNAGEEGRGFFKDLVERGEKWEARGRERVDEVKHSAEETADKARGEVESVWSKVESRVDETVAGALHRAGIPSREEIATLTRRVEELTRVVEQLKTQG